MFAEGNCLDKCEILLKIIKKKYEIMITFPNNNSNSIMQIFVKLLNGQNMAFDVPENAHSSYLNELVAEYLGYNNFSLHYCGGVLENACVMQMLEQNATLQVLGLLDGGKKKKKRKKYTTKKKTKHKHKKVKLSTLIYYSVSILTLSEDGKIQYNRKHCPQCGPGVFMAKHWDRINCGSCHYSFKMDQETIRVNQQKMKAKQAKQLAEKKGLQKQGVEGGTVAKSKKGEKKKGKKK